MFESSDVMIFGFITLVLQISIIRFIVLRMPYVNRITMVQARTINGTLFKTFRYAGILIIPAFSLGVFALLLHFKEELKPYMGLSTSVLSNNDE